jgi:septum formation protein
MMRLVLASTSPYRRELLGRLGVPFESAAPGIDESALQATLAGLDARPLTLRLAEAKAQSVAEHETGEVVVVGSDQVLSLDGTILGKPHTRERAIEQLEAMSGRTHELVTSLVVVHGLGVARHVDVARLTLRRLGRDAIERYVDAERPLDCAGSYKIEGRGIMLFERVEAPDPTAVMGLPLMALTTILNRVGFVVR